MVWDMGGRYHPTVWYGIETISFDFYGMVWYAVGRFSSLIQKDDSKLKKAITHHANHIWQLLV